ncbi:pseudouridine synthase [Mucilaginibacter gilvus]|uniref:Pseudouridine synthase n=1 Tax=Mucilaginibacter gilvus TaxID=2305909 RepID=A0A444MKL8_9SPHI|nr:pseudouridine synthase [Mucilaginibacter gilvus]RWY49364.1 rRNA pseudouridine synthase [Mucilaginibacter gilvus]
MVFKKPIGSRDDKPNRSSARPKSGDGPSKRTSSSSAGKPYGSRGADSKNHYSTDKRSSTNSKPYADRTEGDSERPKRGTSSGSSFSGGEKKAFAPKGRPYSGRPTGDSDRPKRSFGGDERKTFSPKDRPYSGRPTGDSGDDRPKRGLGPSSFPNKKTFGKDKPYGSRTTGTDSDRPKRSFGGEDKPKRAFGDTSGERKPYNRTPKTSSASGTGKKDFANTTSGFKKRDEDRPATDGPTRTMRGRKNPAAPKAKDDGQIRLNRYIANAGICSRRKADELIAAGVVSVNGEVISELGHKVDPMKDLVRYNGEALKREKMVYVLLNKPKDYITTTDDPQERRTVMHLVEKASKERIYPVGRLDRNTTGLLLMTNDGDLADKLSHPRNSITKLYNVELNKALSQGDLNKISFGLELEDGFIKADSISYVAGGTKKEVGIQIHSGKNRIVRRIFESLDYDVVKLDRSVYANLTKKDLPRGRWRFLDEKEVIQLKHLIQLT